MWFISPILMQVYEAPRLPGMVGVGCRNAGVAAQPYMHCSLCISGAHCSYLQQLFHIHLKVEQSAEQECGNLLQSWQFLRRRITIEEQQLKQQFGRAYTEYAHSVPTWMPYVP